MKTKTPILMSACFWLAANAYGQGTFQTITFDGPPTIAPGTAASVTNYYELGMYFRPIPHPPPGLPSFTRAGPGIAGNPDDGTAFVKTAIDESLMFAFTNGSTFGLASVDLSEYSTVLPSPVTISFVGYRPDGSTVTDSFTTPGYSGSGPLTFQTYYFGPEFSGLTSVAIANPGWSMDNLGVLVPEPGTGALLLPAALALGALELRRRRRKP